MGVVANAIRRLITGKGGESRLVTRRGTCSECGNVSPQQMIPDGRGKHFPGPCCHNKFHDQG